MSRGTIKFIAQTINGHIEEFPKSFDLWSDQVIPVGDSIVREFNGNECIRNIKVFLIFYGGQSLGTTQFDNADDFIAYLNASTVTPACPSTYLEIGGCFALVGGCQLLYTN